MIGKTLRYTALASFAAAGLLAFAGQLTGDRPDRAQPVAAVERSVPTIDWAAVDAEIIAAVADAKAEALEEAAANLKAWHGEIMAKVDQDFLPWYFGYWTQQRLETGYLYDAGKNWLVGRFVEVEAGAAERALQAEIAREFEQRVMPGPVLEQRVGRIAQNAATVFVATLRDRLDAVPERFAVPEADWERHLEGVAVMVGDTEGDRSVPVGLKALTVASVVGARGALVPLAKNAVSFGRGVAGTLATGVTGLRAATAGAGVGRGTVALRAGGAAVARAGGAKAAAVAGSSWSGVGLLATLGGIAAWEAWDHGATVERNRPLLRRNVDAYLTGYREHLLGPHGAVGGTLHGLELQVAAKI